jgi:translocation and assembly module TamB
VTRFGLNPQFGFAYYLARSKEPPGTPNVASPLANVRLDVHVVSTPELQVQTSLAKISSNVDLHVRGTGAHPVLLGHINIVEGKIDFNGTTYTLERGDITFANPVTIDPILDIEASAHVRDYDITLGFHGSPLQNKLTSTYRSDPPLPPGDIIALLALGRTREEAANASTAPGAQQQTFSDNTSSALLGQAINATISNRVQKIFGVSRIKIDPQVAGVENSGYARLTVDQQISNKITLTYITNLSQSAQQIIQFEYNINRNVSFVAVRDQNGILSLDVRLRQRKR